jgi:hypothetical protein
MKPRSPRTARSTSSTNAGDRSQRRKNPPAPALPLNPHSTSTNMPSTFTLRHALQNFRSEKICARWLELQPAVRAHLTSLINTGAIAYSDLTLTQRSLQEVHWHRIESLLASNITMRDIRRLSLDDPLAPASLLDERRDTYLARRRPRLRPPRAYGSEKPRD